MKPEEIKWNDWARIALGSVPPEFYLELFIRALLVYALLIVSLRILGKRMSTHISLIELTAMVALASAIGVPMLSYDRGILPAFIIAFIIVGITRILARIITKSQRFEQVMQGDVDILVADSQLCLKNMRRARITSDRLFAHLRSENLHHLGAIKRMYLEANGSFTIVENEKKQPGLLVLPDWDKEFIAERVVATDIAICKICGTEKGDQKVCRNCGHQGWTQAVIEKSASK